MVNRRAALKYVAAGSAIAVAGCQGLNPTTVPVEIGVINNRETPHVVELAVTDSGSDETIFSQSIEINPSHEAAREGGSYYPSVRVDDLVVDGSEYGFAVEVDGGGSTTARVRADCPEANPNQWTARLESSGGIRVHDGCVR